MPIASIRRRPTGRRGSFAIRSSRSTVTTPAGTTPNTCGASDWGGGEIYGQLREDRAFAPAVFVPIHPRSSRPTAARYRYRAAQAEKFRSRDLEVVSQVRGDHLLVPLQPDTRDIRNMQLTSHDFIGLLQDRIRPILPLKPMRRFGDPHDVGGHLGIKMGGNRNACR